MGQTIHTAKNIAGRNLKNALTRLLADREYLTAKYFLVLINDYKNCCAYCNTPQEKLTKEHVVSNSNGGTMEFKNILPVCTHCNDEKIDKNWYDFAVKKRSMFIDKIQNQIAGYLPLQPINDYQNHPDIAIQEVYKKYLEKLKTIDEKFSL
ncbi:HNH endonuclease [Paenibacillus sp. 19GGS1-52]|uniref:HNH endonuclease n=1 Tax=Paenibacillus sp. 19GGS1-52 TaxID=2758563 RepID=UPI001EFA7271|nr:HNH endonuclease [Paenibacillus sp. 19GGS1-52]ULO04835.1 HNH endonuclease [Paenibacillus sp. 19GGS1-52]